MATWIADTKSGTLSHTSGGGYTQSFTLPTNIQDGDVAFLCITADRTIGEDTTGTAISQPSGWTALAGAGSGDSPNAHTYNYKVLSASDAGTSVSYSAYYASDYAVTSGYILVVVRNVDTDALALGGLSEDTGTDSVTATVNVEASESAFAFASARSATAEFAGPFAPLVEQQVASDGNALFLTTSAAAASTWTISCSGASNLGVLVITDLPGLPLTSWERVRSSLSEDAGSILDSASLNAVDASFAEAFLLDNSYGSTSSVPFAEALAPGVAAARYYPIPRQSTEFLNDYSGETLLSRMARVYPPPIFDEVSELGLSTFDIEDADGNVIGQAATAQDVIAYIFSEWASTYSWFTYETVPDLRSKVVDDGTNGGDGKGIKAPSEYDVNDPPTQTDDGLVYTEVIQFLQDDDTRKTMRQILDELLSPFPGTVVRANASGALEIVPVYGPDASNTPVVTLTGKDAYTVTQGQPSPQGVINKWTFRSQPYVKTVDGGLLNQSWFQLASNETIPAALYASGTGEDLSSEDPFPGAWRPSAWSPQSGRFPTSSTGIKLTDSGGTKQVTIDWKTLDSSGSFLASEITLTDIPLSGDVVTAIDATTQGDGFAGSGIRVVIAARYDEESRSVIMWPSEGMRLEEGLGNPVGHVVRVNLLDATDVWQAESTSVSGTYDLEYVTSENDVLPGNPVAASVAAYGTREKTTNVTGWGITDGDLLVRMAKAAVLEAVQPTLIRTVEQSVWRAFPVKFSHMGSVIELPSGEQGRLINRTYADDFGTNFGPGSMSSTVKVEVIDQDGDGVIDVDTEYLLLDDGSAFVLDDGTQAVGG